LANSYPYPNLKDLYPHLKSDTDLEQAFIMDVCQGLRPKIEELKIPQRLKEYLKMCWIADPKMRPQVEVLAAGMEERYL